MQKPVIKDVAIKKEGRFWSVKADNKLLAVVLYRKGGEAVQDLVQRLAGLPVAPKADATATKAPTAKPPGKKPDKPAAKPDPKPKSAPKQPAAKEGEPVKPAVEAAVPA
jgi:hypothetical protein